MSVANLVLDASAMVDLLIGTRPADAVRARLARHAVHVPAHFDAEVLSAIGRLVRAGVVEESTAADRLERLASAAFRRHECAPLLGGAWGRRANLLLVDALYVELASRLRAPLVTTDAKLASVVADAELLS